MKRLDSSLVVITAIVLSQYNHSLGLTWMDKMGSSEKAGNKGFPATSRDGAPIEMTALLKCALDFLIK